MYKHNIKYVICRRVPTPVLSLNYLSYYHIETFHFEIYGRNNFAQLPVAWREKVREGNGKSSKEE